MKKDDLYGILLLIIVLSATITIMAYGFYIQAKASPCYKLGYHTPQDYYIEEGNEYYTCCKQLMDFKYDEFGNRTVIHDGEKCDTLKYDG